MLNPEEEAEIKHLRLLQSDHTRFFTQEEFDRLQFLAEKANQNKGLCNCKVKKHRWFNEIKHNECRICGNKLWY